MGKSRWQCFDAACDGWRSPRLDGFEGVLVNHVIVTRMRPMYSPDGADFGDRLEILELKHWFVKSA